MNKRMVKYFKEIPVSSINVPHPRERDGERFKELARNMEQQGLIHPIRVKREADDRYTLVFGEGRLTAAKKLGWMFIFAQVVEGMEDHEILLEWLTENLQRVNMSPKDKAINIARLIEKHGYTIKQVSHNTGLSVSYIRNLYGVVRDGSQRLKNALDRNMASTAGNIASKFKDKKIQDGILDTFKKEKVSKQKYQKAFVSSIKKGAKNIKDSMESIRKELRRMKELIEISEARKQAIIPNLEKLKKDNKFINKLKIYRIRIG